MEDEMTMTLIDTEDYLCC